MSELSVLSGLPGEGSSEKNCFWWLLLGQLTRDKNKYLGRVFFKSNYNADFLDEEMGLCSVQNLQYKLFSMADSGKLIH